MRTNRFAASIVLLAIGVTACQVKERSFESPDGVGPCQISCTMSATMPEFKAGGDPETKSSLESVVRVKWKKDDELSVINLTTGKQLGGCIKADKDGANSTFSPSGLIGSISVGDKLVFLLDNDPSRRSASEKDFEPFTMDFSSQKGNSNEVPIAVYANYTATENGTINAVNPEFSFLMGYVQLAVSALPASTSVTELGIENLNTKCHFSISNNAFVTTPQNGNITLSEAFTANSKGTNTRYFSCFASPAQGVARNAHISANSQNHITAWLKAALSAGYYYQAVATGFTNENISFVDDTFKSYCVSHYDKNGDGEVSFAEAAAVTSFASFTAAEKSTLKEVYELPYFFKGERIPDFDGCTALKQIILPGTLQTIQENAFKGCTALEEITIPSNVSTVGEGAFEGCTSLERFNGALASADRRYLVRDNHVLAFAPAELIETTIPDGVTTINAGVFANNTVIKTVYLPSELTTVEARAFKGCTALPIIRFRTNIASIGEEAFKGCSALRSVYSDAVTPPTVGADAFANCHSSLAAHVTFGNLEAYEASSVWNALNVTSGQPWNEIWYTTTDGNKIAFEAPSNTYIDGKGVILFNNDLTNLNYSFRDYTTLTSMSLPDGITSIGNYAFYALPELASIILPDSLQSIGESAFYHCSSLTSITLPDGITSIGADAFQLCTSLASVNLPASLTSIGKASFYHTKISSISVPEGITSIESVFGQCHDLTSITLPASLTSIGRMTFYECSSLTSITLPAGLTSLGERAFYGCSSLTSIDIPDGITSIEQMTFERCRLLASITLPDGITSIGEGAFRSCAALESITLPDGITSIGNNAFASCIALESITLPHGLVTLGAGAFDTCRSLLSITIPDNITSIGANTFSNCWALTSVTLPDGITSIGSSAFGSCRSLTTITLPDGITSIGSSAFSLSGLDTITFPASTEFIGAHVLDGCTLQSIFIQTVTPPSGDPFADIYNVQNIYVPRPSVNAYKEAWPNFADVISGCDFE